MTSIETDQAQAPWDGAVYRQARVEPSPLFTAGMLGVLVYTFAGFGVYWLKTGSWTIGEGGRMTNLGGAIWLGPIFIWVLVYFYGRRRPLLRLWRTPATFKIDRDAISWVDHGTLKRVAWEDVGGFRSGIALSWDRDGAIIGVRRDELGRVPARVIGPDGRARNTDEVLSKALFALDPGRFAPGTAAPRARDIQPR